MKGYVGKIETMGLVDGPGIRTVIFLEGCSLRCLYCHNPEMWTIKSSQTYIKEDIINILLRYKSYYDSSNGGVTFSGGEPLFQEDFLIEVLKECKKNNIHTALDTSGFYQSIDKLKIILDLVDLVILDIKHIDDKNYKKITGQTRKKTDEFIDVCNQKNKNIWLRSVIVPGINDNIEYINQFKEFIKKIKNVKKIELLPYHSMAKEKYKALGINYVLDNTKDMDVERLKKLERYLNSN